MTEKATARAHPIQGLVKYHGMRDPELRLPYHDSISLCTAPTATTTTVEWQPDASEDVYVIGDEEVDGRAAERIDMVVEHVRELAGVDAAVRLESENSFPSNIGFGSSSSGFAAAALALTEAAGLTSLFTGYLHRRPSRLLLRGPFGDRRVLPARRRAQRRGLPLAPTRRGRGRRRLRPGRGPPDRRRSRPGL